MKYILTFFYCIIVAQVFGQIKSPEDFGFRHFEYMFNGDKVDILVKSKKGEEGIKKPIFFFCQGSLPQPLIKFDEHGTYGVFPFNTDSLSNKFHIVIVSKPYIPIISNVNDLGENFSYQDSLGQFPKSYSERNLPEYYVSRNLKIIKYLQKKDWVSKKQLVVAGHSEGSTIALLMTYKSRLITHLIYSAGNPFGRMMSIIQQSREFETDTDSISYGEKQIKFWQEVVENKNNMDASKGDPYKTTFDFSKSLITNFEKINIPSLVCYGTKDWSAPFNDFLRVDMIRKGKNNYTFQAYIGTEHNYFPLTSDNKPNHDVYNWDKVVNDWLKWLEKN
ncbi:alpha/beta hydrolase family protein [Belliella marina]|uniref:Alpha/beta hydrolase family protein n=1 Tax=Belliella marina TaxID=1644146 RepID=A0ABW4VI63_9BACT